MYAVHQKLWRGCDYTLSWCACTKGQLVTWTCVCIVQVQTFIARYCSVLEVSITCDGCSAQIPGARYRCLDCVDVDLCGVCFSGGVMPPGTKHTTDHHIVYMTWGILDTDRFSGEASAIVDRVCLSFCGLDFSLTFPWLCFFVCMGHDHSSPSPRIENWGYGSFSRVRVRVSKDGNTGWLSSILDWGQFF